MLVTAVEASAAAQPERRCGSSWGTGIVSLVGPNGAGKTNFLEALYFALTGRSFRTADRRDLIPFGAPLARAEAMVRDEDGIEHTLLASVSRSRGPPPPARRQPGRPGDARPPPPAGRGLLARPPDPGQGPAGRAPRPPRPLRRRALALALRAAPALRPGAGPAQRAALAARGGPAIRRRARRLGRDARRGRPRR